METTKTNYIVLKGHTSQETAYVIADYPWGFKFRTQQRIWLETTKNGTRVCRQTMNPKTSRWCNPKKSTYSVMFLLLLDTTTRHVHTTGFSKYDSVDSILKFKNKWLKDLTEEQIKTIDLCTKLKTKVNDMFEEAKKEAKEIKRVSPETLTKGKLYDIDTIKTLNEPTKLLELSVKGYGVKKRCRKEDYHNVTIGYFLAPETYDELTFNDLLASQTNLIKESVNASMKVTDKMKITLDNVEFEPSKGDSIFYSMKRMLMQSLVYSVGLHE